LKYLDNELNESHKHVAALDSDVRELEKLNEKNRAEAI